MQLNYNYFGARYYDANVGRWWSVEPLAGKYPGYSTYNYALNNPYKFVDPEGKNPGDYFNERGDFLGNDGINDNKIYKVVTQTVSDVNSILEYIKSQGTNSSTVVQYVGHKSDLVNYGNQKISSEQLKIDLLGFSIFLGRGTKEGFKQITIKGGDRNKKINKAVGGAKRSLHLAGLAADIKVNGLSTETVSLKASQFGHFNGIIFYPEWGDINGFGIGFKQKLGPHTHVDLRKSKFRYLGRYIGFDGKHNRYAPWLSNIKIR